MFKATNLSSFLYTTLINFFTSDNSLKQPIRLAKKFSKILCSISRKLFSIFVFRHHFTFSNLRFISFNDVKTPTLRRELSDKFKKTGLYNALTVK